MVLRPALPLPEEGPLLLKVGFADGLSPTHATLALVPAAREVDAQVRVIRHPRSAAALESRLEEVLARCEAGSFTRLVLSGVLQGGVTWQLFDIPSSRGDVEVLGQELYLTRARAVVVAKLQLLLEARPWLPGEARLRDAAGRELRRLPVWMDGTGLRPGEVRSLAVELERPAGDAAQRWNLELRERGGERAVSLPPFTP